VQRGLVILKIVKPSFAGEGKNIIEQIKTQQKSKQKS
jgi:hypothetical protein